MNPGGDHPDDGNRECAEAGTAGAQRAQGIQPEHPRRAVGQQDVVGHDREQRRAPGRRLVGEDGDQYEWQRAEEHLPGGE